ncbi:pantetheine-phosphate adenylyltransferase [Haliovirga abyssi]|uniref:Phosphopantetheine adenylyltransferase n=1 Tax=Haliovirga abyssi TaxID=2996794 RepID=A0AAU9D746_9FUSO|nr:pantetheine-phosphate adenylyltransferase [Haliovirga abyssi]BDU50388.1 phosphopantetheine adenylyltransferase [Haliovirga abyssi]
MNKNAIYPGSFDPISNGHIDIINRALNIFDNLVIAVLNNSEKKSWFSVEERVNMIKELYGNNKKIQIKSFDGLLVDFMEKENLKIAIRGLRAVSDYEYELQLALFNSQLSKGKFETIFLPASRENLYLSSTVIKEIAINNGQLEEYVDKTILNKIREKAKIKRGE